MSSTTDELALHMYCFFATIACAHVVCALCMLPIALFGWAQAPFVVLCISMVTIASLHLERLNPFGAEIECAGEGPAWGTKVSAMQTAEKA